MVPIALELDAAKLVQLDRLRLVEREFDCSRLTSAMPGRMIIKRIVEASQ